MIDFDFDKLDKFSQRIFASFLGLSLCAICGSAGIIMIKSSSFTFSNGQTNINIDTAEEVKANANDLEYANKKLKEKLHILELDLAVIKDSYKDNPEVQPIIDYVDESVGKLEPVTDEIEKSAEKLKQAAKEVVEENESGDRDSWGHATRIEFGCVRCP